VFATRANVARQRSSSQGRISFPRSSDAATGHHYFRQRSRHLRHATLLRADHVMGCNRFYRAPRATDRGHLRRYPAMSSRSSRSESREALVVDEDSAPCRWPCDVRCVAMRSSVRGGPRRAEDVPSGLRTYAAGRPLNTHDMPTFAAVQGGASTTGRRSADRRRHLGRRHERRLAGDHLRLRRRRHLSCRRWWRQDSPADIVLVNLEISGSARPHNVPGTWTERPNWRKPAAAR
jgi:4-alpha-glucanotransferase